MRETGRNRSQKHQYHLQVSGLSEEKYITFGQCHILVHYFRALNGQECVIAPHPFKQNSPQIASAGNATPSFCLHQIYNLHTIYMWLLLKWDYELLSFCLA